MVCVPLKTCNSCFGCLEIANKRGSAYSDQDYQLLVSVAKELTSGLMEQSLQNGVKGYGKENEEFRSKVAQLANENLLTPLLKNMLIILADMLKGEKYIIKTCE